MRLCGWIKLKVGLSLSQAYIYILCKLHVKPIKTAEVAFFHLHFFHWRHFQQYFSLTYTDSAFFPLKSKKKILKKGWKLKELWAKNSQVSFILEQTLVSIQINLPTYTTNVGDYIKLPVNSMNFYRRKRNSSYLPIWEAIMYNYRWLCIFTTLCIFTPTSVF